MPEVMWASQAYERSDYGLPPELCVNMYPEIGSQSDRFTLIPREGHLAWVDTGEAICTGGFQQSGVAQSKLITTHGINVFATDSAGNTGKIGEIDWSTGFTKFAALRNNVIILSPSGDVYTCDGTSVAEITDADIARPVQDITTMDQRVIYAAGGSDQFQWSEVLDATSVFGLSFATAEREADEIVAINRSHQILWLLGRETIEPWQGTGDSSAFAFAPVTGAVVERGCIARHSVVNADNTMWWVGENGVVYRIGDGFVPRRVSTHAIEERITAELEAGNADDILAWTYTRGGHEMVGFRLPTQGTFVFDIASQRWWEAQSWLKTTYTPVFHVRAFNKILLGEVDSGVISELSPITYEDRGTIIERVATANMPISMPMPAYAFRINCVEGRGTQTGQGSDPRVMLTWSDDGEGKYWNKEQRFSVGKAGEYGHKAIARLCGRMTPPGRIWRVRITDPFSFTLRKAVVNQIDP